MVDTRTAIPDAAAAGATAGATAADGRPTLLVIGPVPPPAFGVAKATALMLRSPVLAEHLRIVHLDTSDVLGFTSMGRFDPHNLSLGIRHVYRLARLLRTEQPDVALFTASQGRSGLLRDGLFASLCRTFGSRTTTYLRGSGYAEMRARQGWIAARVLRAILEHSSRVFVLGESLVGMAKAVYPEALIAVVPNGCPPAVAATQVGLRDESHPVVAYIGRLSRDKGLEEALHAAHRVAASQPALEFVLAGEWDSPAYQAQIETLVDESGLSGVVRFPGPVSFDEKADLLTRAWVLVVPSHSEGQPWVILEAMSAGVPVVATDTGAVAETIQDGAAGFVVPVGDADLLADRVTALLEDGGLWRRTSRDAFRRYEERYTVEHSHEALADELLQVARPVRPTNSTTEWFSGYAAKFDRQYGETALFYERLELWMRLVRESCVPGCRVLDAGCGSGVFTCVAGQLAKEVVAIDPSREMLDMCTQRCAALGLTNCTQRQSSIEELSPAEVGMFDLVLASSVLEYVEDLPLCVAALGRLSKPGSTLIASFPNPSSGLRRAEKAVYRLSRHPEYLKLVKQSPSMGEFDRLLAGEGFKLREVHFYGVPPRLRPLTGSSWMKRRVATLVAFVATKT